jgi:anti-sigma regulatory factor (Ser/Thr protein kinase)
MSMLTLACSFAPDAGELASLRSVLRAYLESRGLSRAVCDDLGVVATELAANAIEAAGQEVVVTVRARVDGDAAIVEVEDGGPGFELPLAPVLPSPDERRGRGLWLVRMLTDELEVEHHRQRTIVRAVRRVRPADSGPAGSRNALSAPGESRAIP